MICPFCQNKGYHPVSGMPENPVVNLGGKIILRSGAIRRYTCLHCRRYFRTTETLLDEYNPKKDQLELFNVARQMEMEFKGNGDGK